MYVCSDYEGRTSLYSREDKMIIVTMMIIEGHSIGEMVMRMITIIMNNTKKKKKN
jgi:hypothetical protein